MVSVSATCTPDACFLHYVTVGTHSTSDLGEMRSYFKGNCSCFPSKSSLAALPQLYDAQSILTETCNCGVVSSVILADYITYI